MDLIFQIILAVALTVVSIIAAIIIMVLIKKNEKIEDDGYYD